MSPRLTAGFEQEKAYTDDDLCSDVTSMTNITDTEVLLSENFGNSPLAKTHQRAVKTAFDEIQQGASCEISATESSLNVVPLDIDASSCGAETYAKEHSNLQFVSSSTTAKHVSVHESFVEPEVTSAIPVYTSDHQATVYQKPPLPEASKSKVTDSLNFTNLSMVLGKEKLRRLLRNFEASEEFDDYIAEEHLFEAEDADSDRRVIDNVNIWSSIDGSSVVSNGYSMETPKGLRNIPDVLDEPNSDDVHSARNIDKPKKSMSPSHKNGTSLLAESAVRQTADQALNVTLDCPVREETGLSLETHRPDAAATPRKLLYSNVLQSYDPTLLYGAQTGGANSDAANESNADVTNVTYCYSVDQIYAQAEALSFQVMRNQFSDSTINGERRDVDTAEKRTQSEADTANVANLHTVDVAASAGENGPQGDSIDWPQREISMKPITAGL